MSSLAGVLPAALKPICDCCEAFVRYTLNGCESECMGGLCSCRNPVIEVDAEEEDLRAHLEHLDQLSREINQALSKYRDSL